MKQHLIKDAYIINENKTFKGSVLIQNEWIKEIYTSNIPSEIFNNSKIIDAKGAYLMPGIIDMHVHFREPGLTHKGDIFSESKAAVAGGITSFMDMPNVLPPTTSNKLVRKKLEIAKKKSLINYSFYLGAADNNLDEVLKCDNKNIGAVKVFLGQSTGNLGIHSKEKIENIFKQQKMLITAHCEDNQIIEKNLNYYRKIYPTIPTCFHERIRSVEACYKSSSFAVELAKKYNTRLHILHLSTEKEIELFDNLLKLKDKKITSEVCVHHLFFDSSNYKLLGNKIKWNPSIKSEADKSALLKAVIEDKIDVISSDHAPHTLAEKEKPYLESPSGGPLVQHSLVMMLEHYAQGKISLSKVVEKMCHSPAILYKIKKRGFIRKRYYADLCLFRKEKWKVQPSNILYKCEWSPVENRTFRYKIFQTFVNGNLVYDKGKIFDNKRIGKKLVFSSS